MIRLLPALGSAASLLGAAVLVGGKGGLVGGSLAILLLTAGEVFGVPAFVTAAAAVLAGAYVAALVLLRAPLDLTAPLIGTLMLVALELGHLSLEGSRYALPGGARALALRGAYTAVALVAAFGMGWLILLGAFWLPAAGPTLSIVIGVAAVLCVFGLLTILSRATKVT